MQPKVNLATQAEKARVRARDWYWNNRERALALQAKRRVEHKEELAVMRKQRYVKNHERIRSANRAWWARNSKEIAERRKAAWRTNPNYRVKHYVWGKRHRLVVRAFIDAAMASGCVDCGSKNLSVLDLDHVRGKKVMNVSGMTGESFARVFSEIDKCETRCANCHRLVTAHRRKRVAAA